MVICTTWILLENETHKILWDFEIQKEPVISAKRPDLVIVNKKEREPVKLWTLLFTDHRVKLKESEKKHKYQDLARELKKK